MSARSRVDTAGTSGSAAGASSNLCISVNDRSPQNVGETGREVEGDHLADVLIHKLVNARDPGTRHVDDIERLQDRSGFALDDIAKPEFGDYRMVARVAHQNGGVALGRLLDSTSLDDGGSDSQFAV